MAERPANYHGYDPQKTAHEFETQRPRPLPRYLFAGPSPGLGGVIQMRPRSVQSHSMAEKLEEPYRSLLTGILRKGDFIPVIGTVGVQAVLVRPRESRIYLIIQNTSVANVLHIGVGFAPTVNAAGSTGLILAANGGNYEPQVIPQGDIWLVANAANTQFVMYVAQG